MILNKSIMSKSKLEYLWLDGYKPTQSLRGKTKVVSDFSGKLEDCPSVSYTHLTLPTTPYV